VRVDKEGAEAMTAEHGTPHRARIVEKPDGTYDVGCDVCGHWRYGETDYARADSYMNGHNDAVYGINNNGIPLWFPPVGPHRAISLAELRDLVDAAIERLRGPVYEGVGDAAEVVVPAAMPPLLFLFTPPTEEGWHRKPLGSLYIEGSGDFVVAPREDTV
jgi:hypothetical protein